MKIFNSIVKFSRILQEVDLSGNKIGNDGIEILSRNLSRNKGLTVLRLCNIGINDQCTKHFYSLLCHNKVLKSLDISDNHITNNGLKDVLLPLEKNDTIRHLVIVNNPIEWGALKMIRNTQSKLPIQRVTTEEFDFNQINLVSYLISAFQ